MARWVKISTIGMEFCQVGEETGIGEAVRRVKEHLHKKIGQVLPDRPDLIVLPEWCDIPVPLSTSPEKRWHYVRERGTAVFEMLQGIARDNHCFLTYPTLVEAADGTFRNTVQLIDREGRVIGAYNKNHLVISEIEEGMRCGKDAPVIECELGRIAMAICFDLNFEPIRQKIARQKPELILFPSMYHGGLMQNYWAYSCRAYFVGAIARDQSTILNPVGDVVAASTNYFDFVTAKVNLDYVVAHLCYNLEKIAELRNRFGPKVNVYDPGHLGPVLITSEADDMSALEMTKVMDIELLDDYFARSLAWQTDPAHIEK